MNNCRTCNNFSGKDEQNYYKCNHIDGITLDENGNCINYEKVMDNRMCENCKWYEYSKCMRTYDKKKCSVDIVEPNWYCEHHKFKELLNNENQTQNKKC